MIYGHVFQIQHEHSQDTSPGLFVQFQPIVFLTLDV